MSDDDWDDDDDGWGDDGDGGDDGGDGDWGDDGFVDGFGADDQYTASQDNYEVLRSDLNKVFKGGPTPDKLRLAEERINKFREDVMAQEEKEDPTKFDLRIKSLGAILEIHTMMHNQAGVQETFAELEDMYRSTNDREFFNRVDAVKKLLNNVSDPDFLAFMYNFMLEGIVQHSETHWLRYATDFCRKYLKMNEFGKVKEIVDKMHAACRLPNGDDDPAKADALLNIYALEIELATQSSGGDDVGLNELFKKTATLNPSIADSQAMYTIKKCYGFMFASRNEWERAYNDFFEAFRHISDTSGSDKFECLRYVVVSSMLSDASVNPFASQDARAEESNPNIKGMADLLNAFDSDDIRRFESVLYKNRATVDADEFLSRYMGVVKTRLRSRVLVKLIKPYRRVRLDWLKGKLMADEAEVEALVVKCILDGSVKGRVDQINSVLDLEFGVTKRDDLYEALDQWMSSVKKMQNNLSSRSSRGGSHMGAFGSPWGDFDDEDFPLSDMFGFDGGW